MQYQDMQTCTVWSIHTSALWVSWMASWNAVAAKSCSCPAMATLLSNVAVAAVRTCSCALVRAADSMLLVIVWI